MVHLRLEIHEGCLPPDGAAARFVEAFIANLEAMPAFQAACSATGLPDGAPNVEASVLLCRSDVFSEWDIPEDAVGVRPTSSGPFYEAEGILDESGFMQRLMVAVNLDASAEVINGLLEDGEDPSDALEAWASTITHEAGHLADFVRASGGRTAHELYLDEGDGAVYQASSLEGTEWDPLGEMDGDPELREQLIEERVEDQARRWTPGLMPPAHICEDALDALDALCGEREAALVPSFG